MRVELWASIMCMSDQLETLALLIELSLPDGYRVREVEGRLYLFDPQGIPLHGPKDSSLIEAYAWRHAWQSIDRELNEELTHLRAGVRPLRGLRRLRQYIRMLDAIAEGPQEAEERPVRKRIIAWGAFAASAAAVAAALLIAPYRTGRVPEGPPHPAASSQPATAIFATHHAPALPAKSRASGNVPVPPTQRAAEFAVSFGKFVNRATADTMMHLIRSKGYIVNVARIGEEFWVVTRPYRTRTQAERLANALQEIGLPAQLATTHVI
jgi:SPOR domain